MAKISIEFETGNAAFVAARFRLEIANILRGVADRIENSYDDDGKIVDANGNTVGHWTFDAPDQNLDHDPHEEGPAPSPEQVADEENWYAHTAPVPTPEQIEIGERCAAIVLDLMHDVKPALGGGLMIDPGNLEDLDRRGERLFGDGASNTSQTLPTLEALCGFLHDQLDETPDGSPTLSVSAIEAFTDAVRELLDGYPKGNPGVYAFLAGIGHPFPTPTYRDDPVPDGPTPPTREAVDISTGALARTLGAHFKPRR